MRRAVLALAVSFAVALAPLARAQSNTASSRADALFTQGKAALEAGDYAHACPQLQDSYAIDPANGTLLALALCHEGLGRTATAWREFRTAAEGASKDGRADRAQFARTHIAKLEPRLSKLTVVVPSDAPAGLVVEVDGAPLPQSEWGRPSPIDPGHHTIQAHVAGKKAWTASIDLGPEHDAQTVEVATLAADAPAAARIASPPPTPADTASPATAPAAESREAPDSTTPGSWKRPTGWILGGVGLAAIGIGAYFGLSAITKSSDAKSLCSPTSCTNPSAVSENNDAKTAATISDVAIGAGLAVVALGAFFVFTAPSASAPSSAVHVAPFVGRQQAGVAFERAW
jgi:hypothetical protein